MGAELNPNNLNPLTRLQPPLSVTTAIFLTISHWVLNNEKTTTLRSDRTVSTLHTSNHNLPSQTMVNTQGQWFTTEELSTRDMCLSYLERRDRIPGSYLEWPQWRIIHAKAHISVRILFTLPHHTALPGRILYIIFTRDYRTITMINIQARKVIDH